MAETLTFIHAADLHLGAPFRGLRNSSETWAGRLSHALTKAYGQLINYALDYGVDFVILAGDTFDSAHPSYADCLQFADGLNRLECAGIPVYICTGNHDPYLSWQGGYLSLPDNVHMFSATGPGYFCYKRDGRALAILAGRGFYRQIWPDGENAMAGLTRGEAERCLHQTAPFCIGVLHSGLNRDANMAPVSMTALKSANMDYWALGHFHKPEIVDDSADPHVVYSGNIQGCAIDEPGLRGVTRVTLREGLPNKLEFLPTSSVVWEEMTVDVTDSATVADVAATVEHQALELQKSFGSRSLVARVILEGATTLHHLLHDADTRETLRLQLNDNGGRYIDAIVDRTHVPMNKAKLRESATFAGTFVRASERNQQNASDTLDYLRQAFSEKGLALPEAVVDGLGNLQVEAEDLVLEQLGADRHE